MSIKYVEVEGIRSFKEKTKINFAIPDEKNIGSGLNILVGANNSGKSSLIETLYLANKKNEVIPGEIRNDNSSNGIKIQIEDSKGNKEIINSKFKDRAFVEQFITNADGTKNDFIYPFSYVLNSQRKIDINFSAYEMNRENFMNANGGTNYRKNILQNNIGGRFSSMVKRKREVFDFELEKILGKKQEWELDAIDENNLYIKFKDGKTVHGNNGSGDGFINIFVMLTAIYDAKPGDTIVIDEPEIALHPDVQKRLMRRLMLHAKDKQIIISTHSPYFVDLDILKNGGKLLRFVKKEDTTKIFEISDKNKKIPELENVYEQPYMYDIKVNEVFFLDKLILVEGIDDIVGYKILLDKFKYDTSANFWGWGVGGAERVKILLPMLVDLGYEKVAVILDGDKKELADKLKKEYPQYKIICIEAKDIRDKEAGNIKEIKKIIGDMKEENNDCEILDEFLKRYKEEFKVEGIIKSRSKKTINKKYLQGIENDIDELMEYFGDEKYEKDDIEEYNDMMLEKATEL